MPLGRSTRIAAGIPEEEEFDPQGMSEDQPLGNPDNSDSRRSESTFSSQKAESWAGDEAASRLSTGASVGDGMDKDVDKKKCGKGRVTKKEILVVGAIAIAVIVGIAVAAVVITGGGGGGDQVQNGGDGKDPNGTSSTMAPTPAFSKIEQIETILALLGNMTSTNETLDHLPVDDTFYDGKFSDPAQPAAVRAMSWIINEDPRVHGPTDQFLVPRFSLAVIYYNNGGENWIHSQGWMTEEHTCHWFGVSCDKHSSTKVEQLDLQSNNVTGSIPNEIALLRDLRALWLRRNSLTGSLPGKAFHDMIALQDLYLENNKMTGRIPGILGRSAPPNGRLTSVFLHQNLFSGFLPQSFCDAQGGLPVFYPFGLDCDRNVCLCCLPNENCF